MNRKQNEYRITNMKQQASAVPVEFRDYKDSVMRVARILFFYYVLKGHSASSQGGIILVESTQIRKFSR